MSPIDGLTVERTALLVIDMQRDILDPRGYAANAGLDIAPLQATIAPVRKLLDAARAAGLMISAHPRGTCPRSVRLSAGQARPRDSRVTGVRKLKRLAQKEGARLWPNHGLTFWHGLRHFPEFHE